MNLKQLCFKPYSPSSQPFPYSILVSYFCTSSPTPSHSFRRHLEEESKNIKVSVWWDFENCHLPSDVNVFKVSQLIMGAIRATGIKGPVQITAFGDVFQLSRTNQEALVSTGINLSHVPQGGKNTADRSLLLDLMSWVALNPPPAHLFLISSDRDFSSVLYRLRMNNYNILLATKGRPPSVLCNAASIMWHWEALMKGESLTGKVFNQPPDGPYGSWYGHYKMPLEDPFSPGEQCCTQDEESPKVISKAITLPISKSVVKKIRDTLRLYPKGISIGALRSELRKVGMKEGLYGDSNFRRFLFSLSNILKIQDCGDGKLLVRGVTAKAIPLTINGNQPPSRTSIPDDKDKSISGAEDKKPVMSPSPESSTEEFTAKVQESPTSVENSENNIGKPPKEVEQPSSVGIKVVDMANAEVSKDNPQPLKEQHSKSDVGFFKKIWRKWIGSYDESSGTNSCDSLKEHHNSCGDKSVKTNEYTLQNSGILGNHLEMKEETEVQKTQGQENGHVPPTPCSSSSSETALGRETSLSPEPYGEKSGKGPGLINKFRSWFKFWRNAPDPISSIDQAVEEPNQTTSSKRQLFSEDSFWKALKSFFDSQMGSLLVSQSNTREEMVRNLQNDGPLILRSLNETDIQQLVDILISEKKWVEEDPSEASPFKLTLSSVKNKSSSNLHASNELQSFLSTPLQSKPVEGDMDGRSVRIQNISHAGVSQPVSYKKPPEKSRSDVLMDCRKLVNEIIEDHPEGYNIGNFRKQFLDRYGYNLDIRKLGHHKLVTLLQAIPGVKIASGHIIPSSKVPSPDTAVSNIQESEKAPTSTGGYKISKASSDEELDSSWEELGPVENTGPSRKEQENFFSNYETPLSEDEYSDSEGESIAITKKELQAKSGTNGAKSGTKGADSSLLQILDIWYGNKEDENGNGNRNGNGKDKLDNGQGIVDFSKNEASGVGTNRKQRPQKSYSFVAETDDENQNKLIDGILGSLKKSGESKMHS